MSLLKNEGTEIRDYQKNISETALQKNTLVVLPTGMGKTLISVLVALKRLEQFPESKVLITAPTRPLNAQHKKSFEQFTKIIPEEISLVTGKINPQNREEIYKKSKIVVATPQTIQNDLESGRMSLSDFCFVTFDEAHRAMKDYAYTYIAKRYMLQAKNPLILALTASPGGTSDRINEICNNLFIKAVEIRSEIDEDVEKYVKPIDRDFVYVNFPEEFKKVKALLEEIYYDDVHWLKEHRLLPTYKPNRSLLVNLQKRIVLQFSKTKNYSMLWALIRSSEAIKISHAIELLETQGTSFVVDYFKKLGESGKKVDKRIFKNSKIVEALEILEDLKERIEHPKMEKLKDLVKDFLAQRPSAKIIIFANYRSTVEKIRETLSREGFACDTLVGQAVKNGRGMTQDQQVDVLRRFRDGEFNVLVGTAVSEEGIDVPSVDYAIFYEAVPSEIRAIQRRGRVGRQTAGKVIFLITKDTRDQAYFFSSLRKEKKMHSVLRRLQSGKKLEKKRTLVDWVRT